MQRLLLADNCADVVTAFDSLEHLQLDEVDEEIVRILKPGGTVIASICYHPSKIEVEGEATGRVVDDRARPSRRGT